MNRAKLHYFKPCFEAVKVLCEAVPQFGVANAREPELKERLGYLFKGEWFPAIVKAVAESEGKIWWGDPAHAVKPTSVWLHTPFPAGKFRDYQVAIEAFFKDSGFILRGFSHAASGPGADDHLTFELEW